MVMFHRKTLIYQRVRFTNFIQLVSIPLLDKMTTTGFKHLSTASCTCFFKDGYRNISIFLGQSPTVFLSHRTVAGSENMLPLDPLDHFPDMKNGYKTGDTRYESIPNYSHWMLHNVTRYYSNGNIHQHLGIPATMWGPPVISWFIRPSNYSYKYHKP